MKGFPINTFCPTNSSDIFAVQVHLFLKGSKKGNIILQPPAVSPDDNDPDPDSGESGSKG